MFLIGIMLFQVVIAVCTLIRTTRHLFAAKAPQPRINGALPRAQIQDTDKAHHHEIRKRKARAQTEQIGKRSLSINSTVQCRQPQ